MRVPQDRRPDGGAPQRRRGADRGDGFGNGRLVRDLHQHMLGRQALRLTGDNLTDEELQTLTVDDIVWVAPPPRTGPRLGFAPPGAQGEGARPRAMQG